MTKYLHPQKIFFVLVGMFLMGLIGFLSSIFLIKLLGSVSAPPKSTEKLLPESSPIYSATPSPELTPFKETQSLTPPQASEQVSRNGAGLGDTKANFEKVHGTHFGDTQSGRYRNDYINASYVDNLTYYVALMFENTDKPERTQKEALELAMSYIPDDSVKIKELQAAPGSFLIFYESQKLAAVIPERWQKKFGTGNKPGSFLLIMNHEPGNLDETFAVTVTADNSVSFLSKEITD
ncbi:hypothetical protein [Lyngbya aestuarii]|uniref:hypothetical protein n=1 Tax=Lyngbya aestuarii TaxID=118322 RepID=UPI00403E0061